LFLLGWFHLISQERPTVIIYTEGKGKNCRASSPTVFNQELPLAHKLPDGKELYVSLLAINDVFLLKI